MFYWRTKDPFPHSGWCYWNWKSVRSRLYKTRTEAEDAFLAHYKKVGWIE